MWCGADSAGDLVFEEDDQSSDLAAYAKSLLGPSLEKIIANSSSKVVAMHLLWATEVE